MQTPEQIKDRILAAFPDAQVEVIPNGSPASQPSLLLAPTQARQIAKFLRDDPALRFDYASNATGVDWPEKTVKEKVKRKKVVDGVENETEELVERKTPAFLEAVYHLYSMALGRGPLVIRLRTANRADNAALPSLTPIWRSCEFQEREIFDLFGIFFQGHPDLRRILMWDNFVDHPMRKDYVPADAAEVLP
jgi:NADH-quinone oxidoreductase subunit C